MYPGPNGVSELSFRSNDSTAVWTPGASQQSAVAFLYELSLKNGTPIQSSRVADAELHLPRLDEGKTYILDVWEECDGAWESEHSQLCFQGANSSLGFLLRSMGATGPGQDLGQSEAPSNRTAVLVWYCYFDSLFPFCLSDKHLFKKVTKGNIYLFWNLVPHLIMTCIIFHSEPNFSYFLLL